MTLEIEMLALMLGIAISVWKCPSIAENWGMNLPRRRAGQLMPEHMYTPDLFFAILIVSVGRNVSKAIH